MKIWPWFTSSRHSNLSTDSALYLLLMPQMSNCQVCLSLHFSRGPQGEGIIQLISYNFYDCAVKWRQLSKLPRATFLSQLNKAVLCGVSRNGCSGTPRRQIQVLGSVLASIKLNRSWKNLDSQQQARKKLWVKQTGIKERFPVKDLSQQEKKEPEEEEGFYQPPTRGLRSWQNCFCACESFGHSRGLCCEKRPPHSLHGFAVPMPKTLLMHAK